MYSRSSAATRRHARSHTLSARPLKSLPDWSKLARGDRVCVTRQDGTSTSGVIDMLALDRSIFWIIQEGGRGRVMICSSDKPQITALATADK